MEEFKKLNSASNIFFLQKKFKKLNTADRQEEIEMMTIEEMKEYLLAELKEERNKMLMKQENKYSYIFMLCNDMGIREE